MDWIDIQMYLTYEQALNNANIVFHFFEDKGYTKEAICGLLGNMWRESHVNPSLNEVGGTGYGLTQWTPKSKLLTRLALLGLSDNGDNQLKVLDRELTDGTNNSSSQFSQWYDVGQWTLDKFKTSKDINYTTECFMRCYERPGVLHLEERIEYANKFFQDITGNVSGGGLQLAVLPIHVINVTQSEFTPNFSHAGTEAVDMVGTSPRFPLYAPCDVICMAVDRAEAGVVWQSQREVRRVDGSTGFITFNILHDDTHTNYNVGDTFKKGELFSHTGNSGNSFGDHLHIEASKEKFTKMWQNGGLPNPSKLWYIFSSCDNVTKKTFPILNAGGIPWQCDLNWVDGSGSGTNPPNKRKRKNYTRYNIIGVYNFERRTN